MLSYARRTLVLAGVAITAGCSGNSLGQLGEVLGGAIGQPAPGSQGQITAEVRTVNTQQRTIDVATEDGRTGAVRYDENTVVVYRNQQYPVTALERGDVVVMQVQDVNGALYVQRVDVQQSVQDRDGTTATGDVRVFSGRVSQLDVSNGRFLLQTQNGNVTVSLPYNAPRATVDYFRRLRNGDTVSLEAVLLSATRAEIHRFL